MVPTSTIDDAGELICVLELVLNDGRDSVLIDAAEKIIHLGGKALTLSDSGGFIYDPEGINAEKLAWVKDLKGNRRGRIQEYAERFKGAEFHEGKRPWAVKCELALPCATQNELDGEDARALVANGCIAVAEGANMPTDLEGAHVFKEAGRRAHRLRAWRQHCGLRQGRRCDAGLRRRLIELASGPRPAASCLYSANDASRSSTNS